MRRTAFLSFLAVFLSLIMSSCGRGTYRELSDIESYAAEHPDSALQVLGKIDSRRIHRAKVRARYCLLKSMVLDKNYIDVTDDSLTLEAVRWYRDHGTDAERAKAYYYHGRVQQNDKDYINAIIAFTNAEKYAGMEEDWLYLGLIYRGMARIYNVTFNSEEELKYSIYASECYRKSDDELHYNYSLNNTAIAYNNLKKFDKAIALCEEVEDRARASNDTILMAASTCTYISALTYKENPDPVRAISMFNYMRDSLRYEPSFETWHDIACAYSQIGEYDTAIQIIEGLRSVCPDNPVAYGQLASVRSKVDYGRFDYKDAYLNFSAATAIQDSIFNSILNQSVLSAQKDYFQRQAEYDEYRLRTHRIIAGLVISVLALAIVYVTAVAYRKIREKQSEAERYMGQVCDMVEQMKVAEIESRRALDEKDRQIDSLSTDIRERNGEAISGFRRQIGDLYRLKFNFLDEICRQYYSYGLTAAKQRKILKAVEDSISELSGDRDFSALEAIVNTFKDDVMKKLRDEFPLFKEEEFRLMCYWYAGFSSSAMSLLLKEEDVNAVYKKRSRLKGKIEKSGSPLKEFFIKELSK